MKALGKSRLLRRAWQLAGSVSVRVKVLGIVVGVIVLLGMFVILQMRTVMTAALLHDFYHQASSVAESIAVDVTETLLGGSSNQLALLLTDRKQHYSSDSHNTSVLYILIENADGSLLAGTDIAPLPAEPANITGHEGITQIDTQTIDVTTPVAQTGSRLRLGLSLSPIFQAVNTVTLQIFAITLLMIAVGFAAAYFLTWILTRPLLDLRNATLAVARGDFSKRVPRWANDEIGDLAVAFNAMTESLAKAEQERRAQESLREQYISGVIVAQEQERQRIARELHDSTSQSLTSLLVGLQNLKLTKSPQEMGGQIDQLRGVISGTLDEVRQLSWRLRPTALDDLGLISALEHYLEDYQARYHLTVDLVVRDIARRFPPEMETAVYRIIQEGLNNIARYAHAGHVSVILSCRDDLLRIILEDDGVGFDYESVLRSTKSLGLKGIKERAALFGGTLVIESAAGQGTTLFIEIPTAPFSIQESHDESQS